MKKGVEKMAEMYPEKVGGLPDMSIVTASVDNITMNPSHRFPMDQHLAMQGCVTWVGSSSMEIWIEMRLIRDPVAWSNLTLAEKLARSTLEQDDVIFNSFFLMAARDQKSGKATFVPPLNVAEMGKSDRERFERGEKSATRRKTEAANSLTRIPPTAEEVKLIHHYIMDAHPDASGGGSGSAAAGVAGSAGNAASGLANLEISSAPPSLLTPGAVIIRPKTVPMAETEMSSATMTQPQDRNTNGKIFGGFLMRNAYELARCTSYLFCNSNPYLTQVGSISFLRPVEIGSIISFRSKICYAAGHPDPAFQVRVETLVHDLLGGKVFSSNVFHFSQ